MRSPGLRLPSLEIRVRVWYSVQVKIPSRVPERSVLWLDFAKLSLFEAAGPAWRVIEKHPAGQGSAGPLNTT